MGLFLDDNEDDEYDENNKDDKLLRRRRERNDKDRPLPPLLARVGGSIEVSFLLKAVTTFRSLFDGRLEHDHSVIVAKCRKNIRFTSVVD